MALYMTALTYIEGGLTLVGVSTAFKDSMLPRLLEEKWYCNYSDDGPEHHPVELGWTQRINNHTGAIFALSHNCIYARKLRYGGEPALKPLVSQMRLRVLETFPKFLNAFNLTCLDTLVLHYSTQKSDNIPIHIGSIRRLELFSPNNTLRLSGYIDELIIRDANNLPKEVFEGVRSIHNLTIGPSTTKFKDYPFVTGTVTIRADY